MLKYAKIIKEETKEVSIALGSKPPKDYTEMDVEQGYDGNWYVAGYCPEKPTPTEEEQRQKRQQAYAEEADPLKYDYEEACARYGYESEQALASKEIWLAKKDEIRERYPYPEEESE